jgi:hypothetical protein
LTSPSLAPESLAKGLAPGQTKKTLLQWNCLIGIEVGPGAQVNALAQTAE